MSRFRVASTAIAVLSGVFALAANTSLITEEAMDTYQRAIKEKSQNVPKSEAMLKGLLVQTLTVGIDRSTLPAGSAYVFEDGVRAGVDAWNQSIGEAAFKLEPSSVTADIVVRFVSKVKNESHAQGLVSAQRHFFWRNGESGGKLTGTIQIRDNVGRRFLNEAEVARVTAHELGHLLGLDDTRAGDGLMSDFIPGNRLAQPSRQELDAVLEFRTMIRNALTR